VISDQDKGKAQELLDVGIELQEQGRDDEAIAKYKEAIAITPARASLYYNIGLIYKYRCEWAESLAYNSKAYELDPDNEAACWNMAIAATALRNWAVARRAWADRGITLSDSGYGPIDDDFGSTPVRLNADGDGEVVWAQRIDPVRARIYSIPFPESGFRRGDLVLHDAAAVGTRTWGGREYNVFNVLELVEPSSRSTFRLDFEASAPEVAKALEHAMREAGLDAEDWTASVQFICRQCSEGVPHEHASAAKEDEWKRERMMGISASSFEEVEAVLDAWTGPSLGAAALSRELEGGAS
jgi:tetratricopeptide (TPR) repeat protein